MDFSCIDIRELLDSTLSKWFENPGDKSPNLDDLGIQLDCNDTTKDTSKDTKERFVEPSVIPQVYVNEYNEDIDPTWTNMENAKWASKKEADLVGETDQEGDVFMYNYRSDQEEPKKYFFTDEIYPSGIEPRFYTKAEEETSQTSVVNNVVDNVKDSVSEKVTPQVGGSSGAPRMYGTKPSVDKQMKNYASMSNSIHIKAEENESLDGLKEDLGYLIDKYNEVLGKLVEDEARGIANQYAENTINDKINKIRNASTLEEICSVLGDEKEDILDRYDLEDSGDNLSEIKKLLLDDSDYWDDDYSYLSDEHLDYAEARYNVENNIGEYPELKEIADQIDDIRGKLEEIGLPEYDKLEEMVREIADEYGFKVMDTKYSGASDSRYIPIYKGDTSYKIRISDHDDISTHGPRDSALTLRVDRDFSDNRLDLISLLQKSASVFSITTIEKLAAGYDGYSKSNNAIQAEEEGKFPLSQASKIVASNFGITQKQAKWLLEKIGPCEWHHTSSHYNRTDYYDTNENEIIDSVSSFVEDVSTKEDVVEYVTGNYQAPIITEEGYQADFDYIIWGGTRSHPKANKQHLENVYVVEKGSFYYVYDKKDGNLIVKKKIGSNGTYVHTLPTQEELDAKNKSESEYKALYNYNTSQETRDFIEAGGEWSNSGKFYPSGKKPSPEDYDNGLENFFEVGDTRVVSTEFKGGFIRQEWDGKQFVNAEDTSNMVGSYDELPEDAKNITSTFEFVGIDKLADLFGDGVRQDEIPDSENRFLNRSPITEVNKDQKEELMEKAKKVNKPVTYIPKDLNYPFIEDEMAGNKLFYTDTDFLLDDLYQ